MLVNPACLDCSNMSMWPPNDKTNCFENAPGAQEVQKSVWHMECPQWPFPNGFLNLLSSWRIFNALLLTISLVRCKKRLKTSLKKSIFKKMSALRLQRWSWRCICLSSKIFYVTKFNIISTSFLWCLLKHSTSWFKKVMMLNVQGAIYRLKHPDLTLKGP